jgi:hypothetical protein
LFPNPASNSISIALPFSEEGRVKILDLSGREIAGENLEENPNLLFDISNYPRGVYMVWLTTSKGSFVNKFIKE